MVHKYTVMELSAANGHLVILRDEALYFDFGHIGGGTWSRVNGMWQQLQHGHVTRLQLCDGDYHNDLGFCWLKDLKLIVQADGLHQARRFSLWKLSLDRTLYRRNAAVLGMKLVSHDTPIRPYNDPSYEE